MFKLLIADDEGKTTVVPLVRDEVTIGRKEGNTIRLTERNVSRKHARLRKVSGAFHVSDLKSFNGVKINGRRIEAETELKPGDQISIGDYQISLQFEGAEAQDATPTAITAMPEGASADVPTAIVPSPYRDTGPPARLVMLSAPAPGAEFALTQPVVRIGRAEDLEVWVNHRSISREHAKVTVENGKTFIEDLGSANGVRVNGVDTRHGPIQAGDMVELGQVRFRMVGAGEAFQFDSERTMQLAALPHMSLPQQNRTPLYIALGIVGAAVLGGVGVVFSGGGGGEPETIATSLPNPVTAQPPVAENPAVPVPVPVPTAAPAVPGLSAVAEASACQLSLNSGSFADAIMHADAALRLAPGDANATRCRDAALVARGEDEIFLAGQAAVRQADWRGAVEAFGRLPSASGYRTRPEVTQAEGEYSRLLLSQARTATDPAEARGFADEVLSMASISPAVRAEATAIQRRAPRAATPGARPRPGQPVVAVRPPNPVRPPPGRETNVAPPPQQAVSTASDVPADPTVEASICLGNGDFQCVIRLLGGGRARTARSLAMLAQAQRESTGPASCCTTVSTLLERYGTSREAGSWRQFHVATCQ
jgi:pSer/pThr/pTyr-binding forkhead associated (FHA) protein